MTIIEVFLTLFIVLFTPIPLVAIAVHLLIKSNKWNAKSKTILASITIIFWSLLAYFIFNNNEILLLNKFNTSLSKFFGVAVLIIAAIIEFSSRKALGFKRIFGSSEFKQNRDKLITHGIYKYARHPRYVEHPLCSIGIGFIFGYTSLLWFSAYLLIAFIFLAYFEEQELIKRYGKEYIEYKKKVPAFFI